MATMMVAGILAVFGALFAAMAVTPMVLEEISPAPDESKQTPSPVSFERQLPRPVPTHDAEAA